MTVEILSLLELPGKTCTTLVMKAGDGHDRNNSSLNGKYINVGVKVNGKSYYHNDGAKRYLYSSQKGIWFVCEQNINESYNIFE